MLAVFTGLWRFTYGRFAYLLLENHTVFVYYLSIISLMLVALAMLNCVEVTDHKNGAKVIAACSLVYCVANLVQVLLQLAGVLDLRQMLKITHVMLIISAAMLIIRNGIIWFQHHRRADKLIDRNYSWLLGIGAIADLLLYYFADSCFSKPGGIILYSEADHHGTTSCGGHFLMPFRTVLRVP